MKRFIAALLAVMLLAGCSVTVVDLVPEGRPSGTQTETKEDTGTPPEDTVPEDAAPDEAPADTQPEQTAPAEETPPEEAPPEETLPAEPVYTGGTVSEGVYESAYFSLGFAPGEGWSFYGESALASLSIMSDADVDLFAFADDGLSQVNITVERKPEGFSASDYVDGILSQLASELPGLGYRNARLERLTESFAGKGRWGLALTAEVTLEEGLDTVIFERQYVVEGEDFIALVTVSTFAEDGTGTVAEAFYKL